MKKSKNSTKKKVVSLSAVSAFSMMNGTQVIPTDTTKALVGGNIVELPGSGGPTCTACCSGLGGDHLGEIRI
ncbi:MAG: hypothetical protein AAGG75_15290 [Bacteroidota bacterium]